MRRRRWLVFIAVAVLGACNAITGAHDRNLDESSLDDGGKTTKDHDAPDDAYTPPDASALDIEVDANAVKTIHLTGTNDWGTPNDAGFTVSSAGIDISKASPGAGHAVVTPMPLPSLPTSNYTIVAVIDVKQDSEFGIITRLKVGGGGFILGSRVSDGKTPQPFMAPMGPPSWSPIGPFAKGVGTEYTFKIPGRYKMKLIAQEDIIAGKMWRDGDPEPTAQTLIQDPTPAADRGRGAGFYEYFGAIVTFFDLTISYVSP